MNEVELAYRFLPMNYRNIPVVLENERCSYSHPWSEGAFKDCLKSGNECWVFLQQNRTIGHSVFTVAAGESHLLNVCIHPNFQGYGYGRLLVMHMLNRVRKHEASCVFLEVRASNLAAYTLYATLGFNEIGVRKGYYPVAKGREDALVLAKELLD